MQLMLEAACYGDTCIYYGHILMYISTKVSDLNCSFNALRMHFSITSFYLKSYYTVISLNPILYLICISLWCMDVIVCLVKVKSRYEKFLSFVFRRSGVSQIVSEPKLYFKFYWDFQSWSQFRSKWNEMCKTDIFSPNRNQFSHINSRLLGRISLKLLTSKNVQKFS